MNVLQFTDVLETDNDVFTYECNTHSDLPIRSSDENLLKIFQMNIRSIKKNFDNFLVLVESLHLDIDIFILTETRNIDNLNLFNIHGYTTFYSEGKFNQNDGVVVFARHNLNVTFRKEIYTENTFTIMNFEIDSYMFCVISVYRLPSTNSLRFINELDDLLGTVGRNRICVFAGDINIDILNPHEDVANRYLNIIAENGFLSYVNKPTRVTATSSTIIDHIFVREPVGCCLHFTPLILQCDIADHFATLLQVNRDFPVTSRSSHSLRSSAGVYYSVDYNLLKNNLTSKTWERIYSQTNPHIACENFITELKIAINSSEKSMSVTSKNRKIKPWITSGLIQSIRTRDKLKATVLKNRHDTGLLQRYRFYRNKLNNLLKRTKALYFSNKLSQYKNDAKKTWQLIKAGLNKVNHNENFKIKCNGTTVVANEKIAEIFNEHFVGIGQNMTDNIDTAKRINDRQVNCSGLFLAPVTEDEVRNNIQKLKNNSAPGDELSAKLLKEIQCFVCAPLAFIYNLCIENGIYPNILKKTVVTPVFKSGSRSDPTNYRPISVTSNISKIFEMSLKRRLTDHLKHNRLLAGNQFGFREGVSTEDAIYQVTKTLYNSINRDKKSLAIYLDLTKAFDTLSHGLLLNKLFNYGVRGVVNDLFLSYLSDRQQVVKVNGKFSKSKVVTCGIPQGTV